MTIKEMTCSGKHIEIDDEREATDFRWSYNQTSKPAIQAGVVFQVWNQSPLALLSSLRESGQIAFPDILANSVSK